MIKKFFIIFLTALVTLTSCSLTEREVIEVVHETEVPPKMVFLGDSIAAGYGLDGYTPEDLYNCRSYANILCEQYKIELSGENCGQEMVNRAVSGATSSDLLALLDSGELDKTLSGSDAVIISIGGNDMLGIFLNIFEQFGLSEDGTQEQDPDILSALMSLYTIDGDIDRAIENFSANLDKISGSLHEKTDGQIYIQTLYNPFEYFDMFETLADFSKEKIDKFNEVLREKSDGNYNIVEVAEKFSGKSGELTRIKTLDIHPNAEGHEIIAQTVDSALRETGFSYTTTEQGDKHLTIYGKITIAVGVVLTISLLCILFLIIAKRRKHGQDG